MSSINFGSRIQFLCAEMRQNGVPLNSKHLRFTASLDIIGRGYMINSIIGRGYMINSIIGLVCSGHSSRCCRR
jgi:hypothetical protein